MHEVSLIQSLFEEVERQVAAHGGVSVNALHVRIGELSGVDPELFRSAYDLCRAAGPLARAELKLSVEAAAWVCSLCGNGFTPGSVLTCTQCGAPARLTCGDGIFLDRIEAELPDG